MPPSGSASLPLPPSALGFGVHPAESARRPAPSHHPPRSPAAMTARESASPPWLRRLFCHLRGSRLFLRPPCSSHQYLHGIWLVFFIRIHPFKRIQDCLRSPIRYARRRFFRAGVVARLPQALPGLQLAITMALLTLAVVLAPLLALLVCPSRLALARLSPQRPTQITAVAMSSVTSSTKAEPPATGRPPTPHLAQLQRHDEPPHANLRWTTAEPRGRSVVCSLRLGGCPAPNLTGSGAYRAPCLFESMADHHCAGECAGVSPAATTAPTPTADKGKGKGKGEREGRELDCIRNPETITIVSGKNQRATKRRTENQTKGTR